MWWRLINYPYETTLIIRGKLVKRKKRKNIVFDEKKLRKYIGCD